MEKRRWKEAREKRRSEQAKKNIDSEQYPGERETVCYHARVCLPFLHNSMLREHVQHFSLGKVLAIKHKPLLGFAYSQECATCV